MSEPTLDNNMDDILAGLDDAPVAEESKKPVAKPAKKRAAQAKPEKLVAPAEAAPVEAKAAQAPVRREKGGSPMERITETPREDWPVIILDEEAGGRNFKFVGINGDGFQLKRGVEVAVPPEILAVLNDATATRILQQRDPVTGTMQSVKQNFSGAPYRIVRFGKPR